jgi:LPPG:FO 2-phospho-L-lactate transferase
MKKKERVLAISPIVGGAPIKGPADKLMQGLKLDVSVYGVASFYKDFLGTLIIDAIDKTQKTRIQKLGLNVVVTNTIMKSLQDKVQLAKVVLNLIKDRRV